MTATKLILTVPQAESLLALLPRQIKIAKRSGEKVIVITVKTMTGSDGKDIPPADVAKFAAGAPYDHLSHRFLDAH